MSHCVRTDLTAPSSLHINRETMFSLTLSLCRLIVGWTWEIILQQVFQLLGANEHDSLGVETFVQCLLALVIVTLALIVHYFVKDWDAFEAAPESECEQPITPEAAAQQNNKQQQNVSIH